MGLTVDNVAVRMGGMSEQVRRIEAYRAGVMRRGVGYRFYLPPGVDGAWGWESMELTLGLERAAKALSGLEVCGGLLPAVPERVSALAEATASSRIEGTRTGLGENLLPEASVEAERRDDWREVRNYAAAFEWACSELDRLPLSMRLLAGAHRLLLQGVRGALKTPGEVRRSQNWIGGSSPADARYVPPAPEHLGALLSDLERFLNSTRPLPSLVRAAIAHVQFETFHPFLDGNGRIGRMLVPLILLDRGEKGARLLNLSGEIERRRTEYYAALDRVRSQSDLMGWCLFFLDAAAAAATRAASACRRAAFARDAALDACRRTANPERARRAVETFFKTPRLTVNELAQATGLGYMAASRIVKELVAARVLRPGASKRNTAYDFAALLDAFSTCP